MTARLDTQNIVSTLCAWWRSRQDINRELDEIASLSAENLAEVAADCGVSTHDLIDIVRAGPHAGDEMKEMLKALNIDADAVEADNRRLYHGMMATCAQCGSKDECRRDLRDGRAMDGYGHYCPNAETMDELRGMPGMLAK
jgi:hypothetical protein